MHESLAAQMPAGFHISSLGTSLSRQIPLVKLAYKFSLREEVIGIFTSAEAGILLGRE